MEIVEDYRFRIREGRVTGEELAITFNLSKTPEEYVHDTVSSLAAKQLAASGVVLHAGETVKYVITNAADKVKDWRSKPLALMENGLEYDVGKYLQLLDRAAMEILDGLVPEAAPAKKKTARPLETMELPLVWGGENLLRSKFIS
jgi:DNA polymerase elongation subunit (family B)